MNNYFNGLIIDNTGGATVDNFIDTAIRSALGTDGTGAIPEELDDIFAAVPFSMLDGEVRVKIDFV